MMARQADASRLAACIARRSVTAASSPNREHMSQNSSSVGRPFLASRRSMTRGALTPMARDTARSDGGSRIAFQASITRRMASRSVSVHSFDILGIRKILTMLNSSNTPYDDEIDKMLDVSNIKDMLDTANTMTSGQIAVEFLRRRAAAKDVTLETMAERLGITRQTVAARWARRAMSLDDYIDTCKALDVDPADTLAAAIKVKATQAMIRADQTNGKESK